MGTRSRNLHRFLEHTNSLHPFVKYTLEVQREDKTIPFLDVLLVFQEDGSLRQKVYRKLTHIDRYLHYNSFHHPSIKNSVCKTLVNRAKTICDMGNIEGESELQLLHVNMHTHAMKIICTKLLNSI